MDELEIGGKKYISSKRAAELTGYAKDYVGQLARGGRIEATRVGRAWYVGKEAILALSGAESAVGQSTQITTTTATPTVDSVTDKKTIPAATGQSISLKLLQTGVHKIPETWGEVKYFEEKPPELPKLIERKPAELTSQNIVFRRKPISETVILNRFTESQKTASMDGMLLKQPVKIEESSSIKAHAREILLPLEGVNTQDEAPAQHSKGARHISGVNIWAASGVAVTALAILWISGTVMGSVWTAGDSGLAASITADGLQNLTTEGKNLLEIGFSPIRDLFLFIKASFWVFLRNGFDYIVHLINLG